MQSILYHKEQGNILSSTKIKGFFSVLCIGVFCLTLSPSALKSNEAESALSPSSKKTIPGLLETPVYIPSSRWGYLGTSLVLTVGGSLAGAGLLFLMPESVTNWNKEDIKELGKNYQRKVRRGPVVDRDAWWLNGILHPYWGAVYYLQTRRAGFNWAFSALYSFIVSTLFWEYGIEGFAETPSWQDLVVTPAIGSFFGELFYQGINAIQSNDCKLLGSRFIGKLALFLMDPIGFVIQDFGLGKLVGLQNQRDFQSLYLPKKDGITFLVTYRW